MIQLPYRIYILPMKSKS